MTKYFGLFMVMLMAMFCGLELLAQTAVVVPAAPTYGDAIMAWIKANPGMIASAVAVLEVLLRLVPTASSLSILVPVKYASDFLAFLLTTLSGVLALLIGSFQNSTAASLAKKQ
jgi:hypothetical protein